MRKVRICRLQTGLACENDHFTSGPSLLSLHWLHNAQTGVKQLGPSRFDIVPFKKCANKSALCPKTLLTIDARRKLSLQDGPQYEVQKYPVGYPRRIKQRLNGYQTELYDKGILLLTVYHHKIYIYNVMYLQGWDAVLTMSGSYISFNEIVSYT
jgi:hypothetical protein